jgi:DNA-binding transcriptional LysR family regulator
LGIHSGVAIYSLPPIYKALQKHSPETELQLYHDLSRHLTEEVISNKLDLALVMNPIKHPDLVIIPLIKDQMNIWYNPNFMETKTLIYNPDLIQTQWILKKLKSTKLKFDHYIQTTSFEVAISLAKSGVGACIAPQQICKQLAPTHLAPIANNTLKYTDELCLIFKSGFNRSKVTENLISQIKSSLLSIK